MVRSRTGQPLLSDTICQRRLSFFGHLCRADIGQDHSRALRACIWGPPKDWRRRTGRPRRPGWERLRMICARSTSAWRWQDGTLWIDQHGVYSWIRLHARDMLQRERERERESYVGRWPHLSHIHWANDILGGIASELEFQVLSFTLNALCLFVYCCHYSCLKMWTNAKSRTNVVWQNSFRTESTMRKHWEKVSQIITNVLLIFIIDFSLGFFTLSFLDAVQLGHQIDYVAYQYIRFISLLYCTQYDRLFSS